MERGSGQGAVSGAAEPRPSATGQLPSGRGGYRSVGCTGASWGHRGEPTSAPQRGGTTVAEIVNDE